MDDIKNVLERFKVNETGIKRTDPDRDLSDQINALQRAVARLTYLVSKSLEERHYTALREKGGWY